MNSFSQLPLDPALLSTLHDLHYDSMTSIQRDSIQHILDGRDVLAMAKTGSGKTAAFGIGMMQNLDFTRFRVQALVLCPTRELAEQVAQELRRLGRFRHNIKLVTLTGGRPMHRQEHSLSHEAHIAVGTPGRVRALINKGALTLDEIKMLILDEADRMLDMGFLDQISEIINQCPRERQTLCFSATFPDDVKRLGFRFMRTPIEVEVETLHNDTVIQQHFYGLPKADKTTALRALLATVKPESTLIFCNTKERCSQIGTDLETDGFEALAIHGDLDQKDRTEVLVRFGNGSSRVLVATDVAARGLDIKALGAVINYDLPFDAESYVHRIGRTGRAGREGLAYSFVMRSEEQTRFQRILSLIGDGYVIEPFEMSLPDDRSWFSPPLVTLSINGGRLNKIHAGDVLGALTGQGGVEGSDVGRIDRHDNITFIAIKRAVAKHAMTLLARGKIKGRRFKVLAHTPTGTVL